MRRMILTTLVLLPVMARAQANTAAGPQPSTSSANVQAELTRPADLAGLAAAAPLTPNASFRESVQTRLAPGFTDGALRNAGTVEYSMNATPVETSAPKVTRAVEIYLSPDQLAAEPKIASVEVHATVDQYGIPRNLVVSQSAGSLLDAKALAAVSQYRFKPATVDNLPVAADVTVAIKIQK